MSQPERITVLLTDSHVEQAAKVLARALQNAPVCEGLELCREITETDHIRAMLDTCLPRRRTFATGKRDWRHPDPTHPGSCG